MSRDAPQSVNFVDLETTSALRYIGPHFYCDNVQEIVYGAIYMCNLEKKNDWI